MDQHPEILGVLKNYFDGIYNGDTAMLRAAFHPQATLFGDIKGAPYYKTLEEYLHAVGNRQSPHALHEAFQMNPESIEVIGNIAFVKARCVMLGFDYRDFLSMLCIDGRWSITSKLFTHVEA